METTFTSGPGYAGLGAVVGDGVGLSYGDLQNAIGTSECHIIDKLGFNDAEIRTKIGDAQCDLNQQVAAYGTQTIKAVGDAQCDINKEIAAYGTTNLKAIGDGTCAVIDKVSQIALADFKDRSDIAQRQALASNLVERDIQNNLSSGRQFLTTQIHDQADRVDDHASLNFVDLKNQLRQTEEGMLLGFADTKYEGLKNTSAILEKMGNDKYDNMKDKIDALREEKEYHRMNYGLALQNQEISSLKQLMNSVEQNQQFASKTVQFGTGNTSGTAQTANQG